MILKNLMEEKQLNFNQPLLSVRRGSTTTALPEVTKRNTYNSHPSLPPLPYYKSELKSGPVRNPGAVPFQWEQMPGRPKDEDKAPREALDKIPLAPKLPPGRVVNHKQKAIDNVPNDSPASSSRSHEKTDNPAFLEISSADKALSELERSDVMEEKDLSSSEDEDVNYVDASDKLSRTESFFFNCSVTGVSGLVDGPNMEPSGGFLDPQTRDFMMGRFLPAAKVVASETPQFASRKQPVSRAQPKPVIKVIAWNNQSPRCYSIPDTSPHNINEEGKEGEEDNEVDECDGTDDFPAKLCGLLPRFCLLNPIPGMRDHAQVISSVRSVRTRPAYAGASGKSENKANTNDHIGELTRITQQYTSTSESSMEGHFVCSKTPYKDGSPLLLLDREKGFLVLPREPRGFRASELDLNEKGQKKFKEFLAGHDAKGIDSRTNPAIEKSLYIDSEQMLESRNSNSSSSESRGRNPSVDYTLQEIKSLCGADEKASTQAKSSATANSNVLCSLEKSNQDEDTLLLVDVQQPLKPDVEESTQKSYLPLALAPLQLKSPSESWLSHILPSVPAKNPSSRSYLGNLVFRSSPLDPKRDKMVKPSNMQHMLFHPPGEIAPILEN